MAISAARSAARPTVPKAAKTEAPSKIALPKQDLVYLEQKEGIDPFGLFEEGMDPANENPLSVSNESGKLEVSVGGFSYQDKKKDGPNFTRIRPLAFTEARQKYLVSNTYEGKSSYQLVIDVNRKTKQAVVMMREFEDGKWSGWAKAATYGS
jgi:hypothetical protein